MSKKKVFKVIGIFLGVLILLLVFYLLSNSLGVTEFFPSKDSTIVPPLEEIAELEGKDPRGLVPGETYVPPLEENLDMSDSSERTYVPPLKEI